MNLLYNVGKGALCPPKLIHLKYSGANSDAPKLAIVGKGVTFDTGGLNIKPGASMSDMHLDKSGACISLGLFKWITDMQIPINVSCVLTLAENA